MTETFEKKGMTLITDSFVCRTLQFQERLEKLLYDIHTEFPEKVYSLELLFEKFSGFLKTDMDDGERFDALIKAAAELTSQEAPRWEMIAGWLLDFRFSEKLKEENQLEWVRRMKNLENRAAEIVKAELIYTLEGR